MSTLSPADQQAFRMPASAVLITKVSMEMLPASTIDVSRQYLDPAEALFTLLADLWLKYPTVAAYHFRRHTFTLSVNRGRVV